MIFIFTPLYFVTKSVVIETKGFYDNFSQQEQQLSQYIGNLDNTLKDFHIKIDNLEEKINNNLKNIIFGLKDQVTTIGKNTINSIFMFFFMLYLLFFIFKDGRRIVNKLSFILPLGNKKEILLFERFASIIRSIFKGTLVVALVQGILGGIVLYFVGIESVFL